MKSYLSTSLSQMPSMYDCGPVKDNRGWHLPYAVDNTSLKSTSQPVLCLRCCVQSLPWITWRTKINKDGKDAFLLILFVGILFYGFHFEPIFWSLISVHISSLKYHRKHKAQRLKLSTSSHKLLNCYLHINVRKKTEDAKECP